jgi:uncharacterized protein
MLCPVCNINIQTVILNQTQLDNCPKCKGLWFDKDELGEVIDFLKVSGSSDTGWLNDTTSSYFEHQVNLEKSDTSCPKCNTELSRYNYAGSKDIIIDSCPKGCGIWLDGGELKKILDFLAECDKPLDPETEQKILNELKLIKEESEANEEALIDSLVKMDNRGDILRFPGLVLQFIYRLAYKANL